MRDDSDTAEIRGLTHRYGKVTALDRVDLTIPACCMIGFIGPDGVGKSTLLGLLAGVRKIQHGRVDVLGHDMRARVARRKMGARIAYMPQGLGRHLCADLTVRENIEFFARLFAVPRRMATDRMMRLLEVTDLAPFAGRLVRQLSGGMKQKLGLCCALIQDPDILILDEPTTGVDPLSRRNFWELIRDTREKADNLWVLVATAYMEEAEDFDWLVLMHGGGVLASGSPSKLKKTAAAKSLEEAYARLLPEEKGQAYRELVIPPRKDVGGEAAIEAVGLTRRFGGFVAVDQVSFSIRRGEIFGFVGPNGCGKTTTMKMLTGLLPASAGDALLFGKQIQAGSLKQRRHLGYMSQSFSLYGELTVEENLRLHGRLFDLAPTYLDERISKLIRRLGLGRELEQRAQSLPLGVRQRLALAVAVIHLPEILILDEPTSGVDPAARDRFWEVIAELSREQGVTVLISTHYLSEAARCDRIALMNTGRLLASTTPTALTVEVGAKTLEDAFVALIRQDMAVDAGVATNTGSAAV